MKQSSAFSLVVAAAIGALYSWIAVVFWGWYAAYGPLIMWLRNVLPPKEHHTLNLVVVNSHDAIVNVLLAAPFAAIALVWFRSKIWSCLLVAVLAALFVNLWGTDLEGLSALSHNWQFWLGLVYAVGSLPIAFVLMKALRCRRAHA